MRDNKTKEVERKGGKKKKGEREKSKIVKGLA